MKPSQGIIYALITTITNKQVFTLPCAARGPYGIDVALPYLAGRVEIAALAGFASPRPPLP